MARRVDQIEHIVLAVLGLIIKAHGVGLYGNAAFTLQIHGVENLVNHLAVGNRTTKLDQAISECGLAMINMGDDGEIADLRRFSGHLARCLALEGQEVKHCPPPQSGDERGQKLTSAQMCCR